MMKKMVLAAAVLAMTGSAFAADMPLKAVKAPPPVPSWWDTLSITGLVEVGASGNANNPAVTNFGQLFADSDEVARV